MKQVFLKGDRIIVDSIPSPTLATNRILVANAYSLISTGTESMMVKGGPGNIAQQVLHQPGLLLRAAPKIRQEGIAKTWQLASESSAKQSPLGYSTAGTVLAAGRDVTDINQGDRVACGGQSAHHAEVVSVPRNLVARIPAGVTLEQASFTTIGAIAMHGVRRAGVQMGETVAVLGLGLLGLLAVQIARAAGYKVIAFDIDEKRVEIARQLGIDTAWPLEKCEPVKETLNLTGGFGADAVIVCAATPGSQAVNLAFDLCRHKARVVAIGAFGMDLDRSKMYEKELDLLMSTSYGPGRYDPVYEEQSIDYPIGYVRWTENRNMEEFLHLLAEEKINVTPLISSVFPVEEAAQAYEQLSHPRAAPAVILKYNPESYLTETKWASRISTGGVPAAITAGKIKTAVVGAGGFVQGYRLPALKKCNDYYHIRAIVTAEGPNSKSLADKYGADYASTDYHEVLEDPDTDLVMIGTRHNLHYPIIIDALKAGKKVFTEKPLCLRPEELKKIEEAVRETGIPVIVGFNRRYSPLAGTLKQALAELPAPYLIQYRVSTGAIPANHWTLDPDVGGGRIIGETCHFFDLFDFLVGKDNEVRDIQVKAIPVNGKQVTARDNLTVAVTYADGSLASLTYTTLGSTRMEKERAEVFAGNSSFVLGDYRWLESYDFPLKKLDIKYGKLNKDRLELPRQDKGWEQELIELAKYLRGEESRLISFGEVVRATKITFEVERLSRNEAATGEQQ